LVQAAKVQWDAVSSLSFVTDQRLQALRSLRTFTSLSLTFCENVTAAGAPQQHRCPTLQIESTAKLQMDGGCSHFNEP
jgi:hypothetical protein